MLFLTPISNTAYPNEARESVRVPDSKCIKPFVIFPDYTRDQTAEYTRDTSPSSHTFDSPLSIHIHAIHIHAKTIAESRLAAENAIELSETIHIYIQHSLRLSGFFFSQH